MGACTAALHSPAAGAAAFCSVYGTVRLGLCLCVYVVQSNYVCRHCRRHTHRHAAAVAAVAAACLCAAAAAANALCQVHSLWAPLCCTGSCVEHRPRCGAAGARLTTLHCVGAGRLPAVAQGSCLQQDGSHFTPELKPTTAATAAFGRCQQRQQQGQQHISARQHCSTRSQGPVHAGACGLAR